MKVILKSGIDKLLFGMKRPDVEKLYGKPNRSFEDEDQNIIWLYNEMKMRLTFYADEDFRLGYIICANDQLEVFGHGLVGADVEKLKQDLQKQIKGWEIETFDLTENHFNEDHWLILQAEFGIVTKMELGVVAKNLDDFDWKF